MTRIALIHATPVAMAPIAEVFQRLWPEAETQNLLEDALSADLARQGKLDDTMTTRFRRLARYAADCGADGILFTCSAFGPCIEAAADDLSPLPVLKPNEAMFADAMAIGGRIGLVATFAPSLPSMADEFHAISGAASKDIELVTVCADGALEALHDGDHATHDRLVAEAASSLGACDAIMLAQFSMADAASTVRSAVSVPVLTSPESAVRRLQDVR